MNAPCNYTFRHAYVRVCQSTKDKIDAVERTLEGVEGPRYIIFLDTVSSGIRKMAAINFNEIQSNCLLENVVALEVIARETYTEECNEDGNDIQDT